MQNAISSATDRSNTFIVDDGVYDPIELRSEFCTTSRNYNITIKASNHGHNVIIDGGAKWENDNFWNGHLLLSGNPCIYDYTSLGANFRVNIDGITFKK